MPTEEQLQTMRAQLEAATRRGADLYLDGRRVSADELLQICCVNEETVYMPDYVLTPEGQLTQIRYDKVKSV